jgi:hypothetical protein
MNSIAGRILDEQSTNTVAAADSNIFFLSLPREPVGFYDAFK